MRQRRVYAGIDYFRVVAALLIVAIHTSPLLSISETADFILTRIIARVAVPFFFMTSGFFLFPENMNVEDIGYDRLLKFLKKTFFLYLVAFLLYLPLNIYTGDLYKWSNLGILMGDILFNGTFYHLWYLPAAMMGSIIVWILLKKMEIEQVFEISLFLYMIGLLGDSYYGIVEQVPFLKSFYGILFTFSDYTRNGLFFAPIFLFLGAMIAKYPRRRELKYYLWGLAVSFILLLIEGLTLHKFGVQRHDSMYLMLPPSMMFLFQSLLFYNGKEIRPFRNISMIVYIIHPMIIVLVRGFAKAIGWELLFIDNSVAHFIVVSGASFVAATVIAILIGKLKQRKRGLNWGI